MLVAVEEQKHRADTGACCKRRDHKVLALVPNEGKAGGNEEAPPERRTKEAQHRALLPFDERKRTVGRWGSATFCDATYLHGFDSSKFARGTSTDPLGPAGSGGVGFLWDHKSLDTPTPGRAGQLAGSPFLLEGGFST